MKERKQCRGKKLLCAVIAGAMTLSLVSVPSVWAAAKQAEKASADAQTREALNGGWSGMADGDILVKDTLTRITDGVVEHEVVSNTAAGNDQKIDYMCEIELGDTIKLEAGYGQDNASSWTLVSTTDQAAAYEANHPGETVVAAINADFFNMATGEPMGALVMNGQIYHQTNNRWYFAVLKDGTPVIRNSADLSDCRMAVGGLVPIVKDGQVVPENYPLGTDDYSRCTIGIMADGKVVTSVTHGRLAPVSCGRTYKEIAEMYQRAGCVDALVLDGGGSATYAAKIEGSDALKVRNSPSDGAEREVSSSILVVSTAEATGVFDHAALTPNNELYTPGYEVQFEAHGVDTAGFPAQIPQGATWALAKDSENMGKIDAESGLFTAGKETGFVTVELRVDGKTAGTTTIEIATPDHIYFNSEEVSLGFEEQTDFGIVVRNADRDLHYKDGDLIWTSSNEKLGTFEGNTFIANANDSLNGKVTATSAYDKNISGSIQVIVGMLPTLVWNFEDVVNEESGEVIPAETYYTGENGILTHSNYGRGGKESIEIVSIDEDEPVRFGEKSLKLNYDFIDCGAVTEGACIGTTSTMEIPGSPTGIGVWVYAPEGVGIEWNGEQAGFWLRGYVKDGAGNNMPYNFTLEPKDSKVQSGEEQPGIYWEGWKYLEADLTSMNGPFSIQSGMTFRLMFVAGTNMGTRTAGSIYFDNLQFVYGTNIDDTDEPVIDSIRVNDAELENGAVLDTDTINVTAMFHDVENKYTTGIDASTVRMYLDGISVVDNPNYQYVLEPDGTINHLYHVTLLDGMHSITVSMRDGFGNETSETRFFEVRTGQTISQTTVSVLPAEQAAILGTTVNLEIRASGSDVTESLTQLRLSNQFPGYEVVFSDNYEGESAYSKLSDTLSITAKRKDGAAAADGNLIATVVIPVPSTLNESSLFTYIVKGGEYTTASGFHATYSMPEQSLPVAAPYKISTAPVVVGQETVIRVENQNGEAAGAVGIYLAETNEKIGETDGNGEWVTDYFSRDAGTVLIYAMDADGLLSFQTKVESYLSAGEETKQPYGILFNATGDNATAKNISWFSHTAAGAQSIAYRVSGTDEWTVLPAYSKLQTYTKGGNSAAMVNQITLTGLSSKTTYEYRVGSGEDWSEIATFKTGTAGKKGADFFVLGDIQAEDTTNISKLVDILKGGSYDFGIQTGDAVDDATSYSDWMDIAGLFGTQNIGNMDMLHVLGNHEYAGDATASAAAAAFGLPCEGAGTYYSVTYGNTYLAVINYTGTGAQLKEALAWLVEDAKASNATWKVLCMHQPAYYTNANGGNGEIYNQVPDAAEAAGINVVFSGHDHTLARTNQIKDDQIDEENGIVYYIAGSSGEKAYSITSQKIFDYDTIFALATQDFTATYLTVHADEESMTIQAMDLDRGMMDSVTLYTKCVKNGHTYLYDPEKNCAVCGVCGEENAEYTGELQDVNGNGYYLIAGVLQTGWKVIGTEECYFGANGIKEEVTKTTDVPTTCTVRGYYILTSASGATRKSQYEKAPGHEYEETEDGSWKCTVCGHTRVELTDCQTSIPYTLYTYTGKRIVPYPVITAPDGTQLHGGSVDFYVNWSNNVEVGTATMTATAKRGYYVNTTEFRGDYGGIVTKTYEIRPDEPKNLQAEQDVDQVELTWTDSLAKKSAPLTYDIYQSADGVQWKKIGTTDGTSYTVTGLNQATTYYFRLRAKATVDGKSYVSIKYTDAVTATTDQGEAISNGYVSLSWTKTTYNGNNKRPTPTVKDAEGKTLQKGADYNVTYENNVQAGEATVVITGNGRYYGELRTTFTIAPQNIKDALLQTSDVVYNGANTETVVTMTDKNGLPMEFGRDYTISCTDNSSVGTAKVAVTGIGNYTGTLKGTYTITERTIADFTAYAENAVYTGREVAPNVWIDGLTRDVDYLVTYDNNVNVGIGKAILTGIGNYTGSTETAFEITPKSIAEAVVTDGSIYSYTGSEIAADVNVVVDGISLAAEKDYVVLGYENNVNVGTAVVTLQGIGNYTDTVRHEFVIETADVAAFTVSLQPETFVYSGAERRPEVTVTSSLGIVLQKDVDYEVSYENNKNAGTAIVKVNGIGNYSGTVERTFVIETADIAKTTVKLGYKATTYSGGVKVPAVVVKTARGTQLKRGTNYTVTYLDNKNAGTASVVISGIGNYGGKQTVNFEIKPADLTKCSAAVSGTYYETGKEIIPSVTVKTAKGTRLKEGLNYTVSASNNVQAGKAIAIVTGIGNYKGELQCSFEIKKPTDLSKCKVSLGYSVMTYTGEERTPKVKVVTAKGTVLKNGTNYTVEYTDNVEVGTAEVTVRGIGKYAGTVTKTFKIRPQKVTGVEAVNVAATTAKIRFRRNETADKYYIYVNGSYTGCVKTLDTYTIKNLKSKTAYDITVKAVKVVDGKNYYSAASEKLSITTK